MYDIRIGTQIVASEIPVCHEPGQPLDLYARRWVDGREFALSKFGALGRKRLGLPEGDFEIVPHVDPT